MIDPNNISIRLATPEEADIVGDLICRLLCELFPEVHHTSEKPVLVDAAKRLLPQSDVFNVAVAFQNFTDKPPKPIGLISLAEGYAIYAKGRMGVIVELFVDADYRSTGLGEKLINYAIAHGKSRDWKHLEVGAPDVPRWQRSVNFYKRMGFDEIGPRLELSL